MFGPSLRNSVTSIRKGEYGPNSPRRFPLSQISLLDATPSKRRSARLPGSSFESSNFLSMIALPTGRYVDGTGTIFCPWPWIEKLQSPFKGNVEDELDGGEAKDGKGIKKNRAQRQKIAEYAYIKDQFHKNRLRQT